MIVALVLAHIQSTLHCILMLAHTSALLLIDRIRFKQKVRVEHSQFKVSYVNYLKKIFSFKILSIAGQPIFDPTPPIITALGSQATLPCDVQSSPAVTSVSWSLRNQPLASGGRILITQTPPYTLTITSVQSTDVGYYVCAAQNSFGRNSTTVRLTIGSMFELNINYFNPSYFNTHTRSTTSSVDAQYLPKWLTIIN